MISTPVEASMVSDTHVKTYVWSDHHVSRVRARS